MLQEAGIEVSVGPCADAAARDQAGFLSRVTRGRPLVTLKLASSLDGRIATASGESRWITGPAARRVVHGLRLNHDAVLVGGGTARADDPELTVRGFGNVRQPVRVIAARTLKLPTGGKLAASAGDAPLWLLHGARDGDQRPEEAAFWSDKGARLLPVPVRGGRLEVTAMLSLLAEQGLTRVFCEGGGALAAALLQADVVDRLVLFSAGLALGAEGWPALGAMGIDALAEAPRFRLEDTRAIGPDVMQSWTSVEPACLTPERRGAGQQALDL